MRLWELEAGDDGEIGLGYGGGHGDFEDDSDDEGDDEDEPANLAAHAIPVNQPPRGEIHLDAPQRAAQRGDGNAQGRGRARNPAPQRNQGLQRFIQMAENDEEDDWDSEDLSDDEGFD